MKIFIVKYIIGILLIGSCKSTNSKTNLKNESDTNNGKNKCFSISDINGGATKDVICFTFQNASNVYVGVFGPTYDKESNTSDANFLKKSCRIATFNKTADARGAFTKFSFEKKRAF